MNFHAVRRQRRKNEIISTFAEMARQGAEPSIIELAIRMRASESWVRETLRAAGAIPMRVHRYSRIPDGEIERRIEAVRRAKLRLAEEGMPANLTDAQLEKILPC